MKFVEGYGMKIMDKNTSLNTTTWVAGDAYNAPCPKDERLKGAELSSNQLMIALVEIKSDGMRFPMDQEIESSC